MAQTAPLPQGTVTFLFTDIEGSTRIWEEHPEAMQAALARHDALLQRVIQANGGHVFKKMGDQFCAAFSAVPQALTAAVGAQHDLRTETWGEVGPLRVRMAVHTGAAHERDGDYFGSALSRVARLMAAGHGGQILVSSADREAMTMALPQGIILRDLGEHRLRDLARPARIYQLLHPDLPADFPPLRSLEAFAHNLPTQLSSFIGREQEIADVKQRLSTTRLLTLTGAGGCGKTRLALQVAAEIVDDYADGVWLVELAALTDPALVPQAAAGALGAREAGGSSLTETLVNYLRPKSLLLVLDNCEHLIQACAQLAETLLQACPHLCMLATSREALRVAGEIPQRVPSLLHPDPSRMASGPTDPLTLLTQYDASRLFLERARTTLPSFAVTSQSAPAVAQICHRLDGIPLAIELAAARVKVLSVEQIATRLDDMFRLLTGGSRTALPRQQTLRALIEWSYGLLEDDERTLLRRLFVFAGGWTLDAAEAVGAGDGIEDWEVLDLLSRLVDKSLVMVEEGCSVVGFSRSGQAPSGRGASGCSLPRPNTQHPTPLTQHRYRMLETVRQYGRERLLEAGEAERVRERHACFFASLVEQANQHLFGAQQTAWMALLETEHDNVRTALSWSQSEGGGEIGLRLIGSLFWFWVIRGYSREGRLWAEQVLARTGGAPGIDASASQPGSPARTAVRGMALLSAGGVAWAQGDFAVSRPLKEEGLAIARELGDKSQIALSLRYVGWTALDQGNYEVARSAVEESLSLYRELGDKIQIARSLNFLAHLARVPGDVEAARKLWEEALTVAQEGGDQWSLAMSVACLAKFAESEGDLQTARSLFQRSLALRWEIGDQRGIAECLEGLAAMGVVPNFPTGVAGEQQVEHLQRAARLFGAAEAVREAIGAPLLLHHDWHVNHEAHVADARTALGEEAFAAAWAQGRTMLLEQAVREALSHEER